MTDYIVNEKEISFNELEKIFYNAGCAMACKMLTYTLEEMDKEIAQTRDKKEYRHKGKRKTTIKL